MLTEHILSLLTAERDKLNRAIEALSGSQKRRGRPPKNVIAAPIERKRKRRTFTTAQRKAQSEKMKAFWAAKRTKTAK